MKKGKKNNEAPERFNTTNVDTRVDNETKKKQPEKRRAIPPNICITQTKSRSNLKTGITNTTELFTQAKRGFLFYRFRSTCVTNVGNSLRRSTNSPAT